MQATLLFDQDCGFCRWSLGRILAWDRANRILPVALQSPEADRLLSTMDRRDQMATWHLVTPDGVVRSGGDAVAPLARLLPGGTPIALVASLLPGPTRAAYRFVARHRGSLARIIGERACRADPMAQDGRRRGA